MKRLELFMAGGYFGLLDWLDGQGKKIFVDLKFFDVPNTVASAIRQLSKHRPAFATVHGNDEILRVMEHLRGKIHRLILRVHSLNPDRHPTSLGDHRAIAEAVIAGDAAGAVRCVEEHLAIGQQYVVTPRRR